MPAHDSHDHNHTNDHADESTSLLPSYLRGHVHHEGESGRSGFSFRHFLAVSWRSSNIVSQYVNILWPFTIIAIVCRYVFPHKPLLIFAMSYLGVIPASNLLGFAGQEFARKMPKVAGILIETAFGGLVEIVLLLVLIVQHKNPEEGGDGEGTNGDETNLIPIIQAAILGSILTNLLLCLGLCFFVGGLRQTTQKFHSVISETGSGLLLVAGFGLLIPSAFYSALKGETVVEVHKGLTVLHEKFTREKLQADILHISQVTSVVLVIAFLLYTWYNAVSHQSLLEVIIEEDEHRDADRAEDAAKMKLTFTETLVGLLISMVMTTWMLIILVSKIEDVVESGCPDQFLGLIILPLAEKAAEHLTSVDESWDGTANLALYHCIGPSIQTALFNGPLVVLVGWALGKSIDLNFEIYMAFMLVLSIIVVGNFLRDGESNWLEGALLVIIYVIIGISAFYYPNPDVATSNGIETLPEQIPVDIDVLRALLQRVDLR